MWDEKEKVMEGNIRAAGMPPLTADERATILQYLERYAGTE